MKCEKMEELLSLYAEGETNPDERELVEAHLRACASCSELLSLLKETKLALTSLPELEVSEQLLSKLYAIPEPKKKSHFSFEFLLKPSLQPIMTVATVFLIIGSLYFFNPNRRLIDKAIDRQVHLGYGKVEKLYASAGSVTDSLGSYADNFLGSLKNLKFWEKPKE